MSKASKTKSSDVKKLQFLWNFECTSIIIHLMYLCLIFYFVEIIHYFLYNTSY